MIYLGNQPIAGTGAMTIERNAKAYTDAKLVEAKSYADNKDATTLASAKSYSDTQDATTLTSAKSYADNKDATTLASAKSYADTQDVALRQILVTIASSTPSGTHMENDIWLVSVS